MNFNFYKKEMTQIFNTHINLKNKIDTIKFSLSEESNKKYEIEYGEGYHDKDCLNKYCESFKIIENNIIFNTLLVIDNNFQSDNIFFDVFNINEINKKYEIINKYILDKLKYKYKDKFNVLKNNNHKIIIGIKIYIINNNILKITLKIEKIN